MNIQKVNYSASFGKTPVMLCEVRDKSKDKKVNATLYKMDLKNGEDMREIEFSKTARILYDDARKDCTYPNPTRDYYLLKEDKTGEVISAASVSRHFRRGDDKKSGFSYSIDGFADNGKYLNCAEPLIGYIANNAIEAYRENIIIGTSDIDKDTLKQLRFTQTKNGEWYMPERRFSQVVDTAEKRYNMIV